MNYLPNILRNLRLLKELLSRIIYAFASSLISFVYKVHHIFQYLIILIIIVEIVHVTKFIVLKYQIPLGGPDTFLSNLSSITRSWCYSVQEKGHPAPLV
jgi:hypothetical protein